MNKNLVIIGFVIAIIIVGGFFVLVHRPGTVNAPTTGGGAPGTGGASAASFDPLNATYTIDGQAVTLVNGTAEVPAAPGSATKVVTKAFGAPVAGDLNGDGKADAALFLVQEPGGSGTFYYATVAIATATGTQGTNAVLLGDRVAPQTIEIHNGQVLANYADRKPGEPMSTAPSVGVTKYLRVENGVLIEAGR